jgi:flagellar hook protein FlgE
MSGPSQKNKNTDIKKISTLENKHRQKIKEFEAEKESVVSLENKLNEIKNEIGEIDKLREKFTNVEQQKRAHLLDTKDDIERKLHILKNNISEMDYYDKTGDILMNYYNIKNTEDDSTESKSILSFLCKKKQVDEKPKNKVNKTELFEKYCQITEGIRVNPDDGSKRIKYCLECKIEKILNLVESSYICPLCGDMEMIIMDEDVQIKDYSPYKRLNRFREWLNAFQAKQSPEIDDIIFKEIIDELNRRRITDLSTLNREKMRSILKKLKFNHLYEHTHYIINKLSGLPPPKITRDMEKMFIRMFLMIQDPWYKHKPTDRKNFLSYGYVLHKFCELLELDHLLDCFPLHKQLDILMENDTIWKKICTDLNWDFISSFK